MYKYTATLAGPGPSIEGFEFSQAALQGLVSAAPYAPVTFGPGPLAGVAVEGALLGEDGYVHISISSEHLRLEQPHGRSVYAVPAGSYTNVSIQPATGFTIINGFRLAAVALVGIPSDPALTPLTPVEIKE